jgi:hypothetical protein
MNLELRNTQYDTCPDVFYRDTQYAIRASALYICRERSTNHLLFMQNKPNFRKSQMNVNIFSTMDYENLSDWTIGQNKPNSNPIKPNLPEGKK